MPIFSNLSRRFHMLTTDAKPDPPRIPIEGYTHNLPPNTEKNKTKQNKLESEPIVEEPRGAQNDVTSERKKSFQNDATPIPSTNCSADEKDLNDTKFSNDINDGTEQKRTSFKPKAKQNNSRGSRTVNYNIVNSSDVKIGPRTSYICNVNQFSNNTDTFEKQQTKFRKMPIEVEHLCASNDQVTLDDIFVIKTYIGRGWRDVARRLSYSDGQIEQFEENYRVRGISEVIYQIFLDWKQANTKDANIGKVISILWACKEYDCTEQLVSARNKFV